MFLAVAIACVICLASVYRGISTLVYLDRIETERDRWQRPTAVIRALDLRPGNVVADLGCGSGYFALKLSRAVESKGRVLAVDIRRLPLAFLQARALLANRHNITAIRGDNSDPRLPAEAVDAVLVVNTYHELEDRKTILGHVFRALVPGGRLVVVDRLESQHPYEAGGHTHEIAPDKVEHELQDAGFQSVARDDRFIEEPGRERWWSIIMRRPVT